MDFSVPELPPRPRKRDFDERGWRNSLEPAAGTPIETTARAVRSDLAPDIHPVDQDGRRPPLAEVVRNVRGRRADLFDRDREAAPREHRAQRRSCRLHVRTPLE